MTTKTRRILVTSALPYANGALHLGHILEAIQTDIWARFQRLRGHECHYICADDAHGTPIMLRAETEGISPEALIERVHAEHVADFADFGIQHASYHSTHSEENRRHSERIYELCRERDCIAEREITQDYDAEKGVFLSDRYIIGRCPRCGAADQYGDNCEVCGASYDAAELGDRRSALSGKPPEQRKSVHYFFELPKLRATLERWLDGDHLQPAVVNKLREWLDAGLKPWDISRDAPYFGFQIPGAEDKYFYVWLDAPIGYMASSEKLNREIGADFDDWWGADSDAELHHFIGKDIINFHGLFWPALLDATGHRLPTAIHAHGFLTVNGEKMSKSRGTFILARRYLEHLDADALRYYFAAKLDGGVGDIDLNLDDLRARINADLVGKFVNIASRCGGFLTRGFEGRLAAPDAPALVARGVDAAATIAERFETREYAKAIRDITALADETNAHISERAPWDMAKKDPNAAEVQAACSTAIAMFRLLALYLKPVTPDLAERAEAFLGEELRWNQLRRDAREIQVAPFEPMRSRIEEEQLRRLIDN